MLQIMQGQPATVQVANCTYGAQSDQIITPALAAFFAVPSLQAVDTVR
jgi:hypothetical protein